MSTQRTIDVDSGLPSLEERSEKTFTSEERKKNSMETFGQGTVGEEDIIDESDEDLKNIDLNDMTCKPSKHRKKNQIPRD
jgi:hypothetical protein